MRFKLFQRLFFWRTPECCRRKRKGGEMYQYFRGNFRFDVELANQLVRDGREPVELDEASVRTSVERTEICQEHLAHVDVSRPGIIAHVQCTADDGEIVKGHILIDGNHRAARCLELNRPFLAYLLSEAESKAILLRQPTKTFPKVQPEPAAPSGDPAGGPSASAAAPSMNAGAGAAEEPRGAADASSQLVATQVPLLRSELIIRDGGGDQFVIKDPRQGKYFNVGQQEHFLLTQFDGRRSRGEVCLAFEARFGEPLTDKDIQELIDLAKRKGLLQSAGDEGFSSAAARDGATANGPKPKRQSLLSYRIPLFNPDRLLTWLEPRLRFVFSPIFVALTVLLILTAAGVAFVHRAAWINSIPPQLTWQTLFLAWGLIAAATLFHELAHGLTCKHFGGEVREIGFLLLFFIPCFYCNVSDAWMLRERRQRLWISFAGTHFDLVLWAASILAWRATVPDTAVHYGAWLLSTICGARCFFNLNPLIKLDGYYLLSDWTRRPNLAQRARKRWVKTLQWLLWGARRPSREPGSAFLLWYGLASWLFLGLMMTSLALGAAWMLERGDLAAYAGAAGALFMTVMIGHSLLRGIFAGEFFTMFKKRWFRASTWAVLLAGIPAALFFTPVEDRASGSFVVRPSERVEINAPETGFLRDIAVEEGSLVSPGQLLARVEIPDLEVRRQRVAADLRESQANLRRLQTGPRPEEVEEQRSRVARGLAWCELGQRDLESAQNAFAEEAERLRHMIAQYEAELEFQSQSLRRVERLFAAGHATREELEIERTGHKVREFRLQEANAEKRVIDALGTRAAETELARRDKELADDRAKLRLLEAGGRAEDIEAEQARTERLLAEQQHLEFLSNRVHLLSPIAGVVTTARLREKAGQFVPMGTIVCVVEQLAEPVIEIAIQEESALGVLPGQRVELRTRARPFDVFETVVERKAPRTTVEQGNSQGAVTVYCRLNGHDFEVLSGMSGHARIHRGQTTLGKKMLKFFRTEFLWW